MENRYWGGIAGFGLIAAIMLSAGTSAVGAAAKKKTKKTAAGSSAAITAKGKGYVNSDCLGCHKIGGKGGTTGPDLSQEGAKASAAEIAAKIKNPKAKNPNSIMPASKRPAADIAAMTAYLASLK